MTTPTDVTNFVNQVVAWDNALQSCADKALAAAKAQYEATTIDSEAYSTAVDKRSEVAHAGAEMTENAIGALASLAAANFSAISAATNKLSNALKTIESIEKGVNVLIEVATVAATVVAALATPSVTAVAAAATAVNVLVTDILKPSAPPQAGATGGAR